MRGIEERIYRVWNDSLISENDGEPYLPSVFGTDKGCILTIAFSEL